MVLCGVLAWVWLLLVSAPLNEWDVFYGQYIPAVERSQNGHTEYQDIQYLVNKNTLP